MTRQIETEIARMQGEISAIETRIDRAWEGIKADLKRQEWLRQQIIMRRANAPEARDPEPGDIVAWRTKLGAVIVAQHGRELTRDGAIVLMRAAEVEARAPGAEK